MMMVDMLEEQIITEENTMINDETKNETRYDGNACFSRSIRSTRKMSRFINL